MNTIREKEESGYFNAGVALGIFGSTGFWIMVVALASASSGKRYNDLQAEAVKLGAAEWVASEHGSTTFIWKESK